MRQLGGPVKLIPGLVTTTSIALSCAIGAKKTTVKKAIFLLIASLAPAADIRVAESARNIPVAAEVDVVVAGGSTGAVAAAVAAAEKGARVFLAAPRTYLGEDLCATMRLWLEEGETPVAPLARRLFAEDPDRPLPSPRGPFRPMHIKRTLDQALIAAKVEFLFGSYVTDLLHDASGAPAGVVIANRAGRQAVLARVIIDATDRAWVARLAGAHVRPFPRGEHEFRWVALSAKPAAGVEARKLGLAYSPDLAMVLKDKPAPPPAEVFEYKLRVPLEDGSWMSLARAEQTIRDKTYTETDQAITEEPFLLPPDPIRGARSASGAWKGVERLPVEAFRPAGVKRVFVLSARADISREQAEKLARPLNLIDMGTRLGAIAAEEARSLPAPAQPSVRGAPPKTGEAGDTKEILAGVRPSQRGVATVESAARALPVLGFYDVVVVGGGTGGAPAGIGAGRAKAKTLVVEYLHGLGGVGTMGLISSYYWGFRGGFTKEVPGERTWNPIARAEWWRRTLRNAGAEIWFGVIGCGAFVDKGRVKGVVIATPEGRGVVLAKVVIDSTGNSDIAASAGAETMHTGADEMAQQGTGLPPVRLAAAYTNNDFTIADETDMADIWHLFVYSKDKFAREFDLGQLVNTRERRRVVGDFVMSLLDQINDRKYPDTISIAYSNFDTHGYTTDPYLLIEHPERKGVTVRVPYRCLLPKGLDGILVTGLSISVHRDAVPLTRMQPDVQNQGFAAGMAAAAAARENKSTRAIDIRALQKQLAALGIVPETTPQETDSYPIPESRVAEAVASLKEIPVILAAPETASPLLRKAFRAAVDEKDKLAYAHILAVLGDASGLDVLTAAVQAQSWDQGWNYRGMGQFGNSLSHLDTLIVALGRTRDRRALPVILSKIDKLDASSEFSHHRAVALALEMLGDPAAAAPLAALLARPGMRGHVITDPATAARQTGADPNETQVRARAIRELSLARALYRCGDKDGIGKKILQEYTKDLRGHLARHAQAVLEERR